MFVHQTVITAAEHGCVDGAYGTRRSYSRLFLSIYFIAVVYMIFVRLWLCSCRLRSAASSTRLDVHAALVLPILRPHSDVLLDLQCATCHWPAFNL